MQAGMPYSKGTGSLQILTRTGAVRQSQYMQRPDEDSAASMDTRQWLTVSILNSEVQHNSTGQYLLG